MTTRMEEAENLWHNSMRENGNQETIHVLQMHTIYQPNQPVYDGERMIYFCMHKLYNTLSFVAMWIASLAQNIRRSFDSLCCSILNQLCQHLMSITEVSSTYMKAYLFGFHISRRPSCITSKSIRMGATFLPLRNKSDWCCFVFAHSCWVVLDVFRWLWVFLSLFPCFVYFCLFSV